MSYQERQALWVKENNIQEGDTVRVCFAAPSKSCGWICNWDVEMNSFIGQCFKIFRFDFAGIWLAATHEFVFPYFCLEKVETKKPTKTEPTESVEKTISDLKTELAKTQVALERISIRQDALGERLEHLLKRMSRLEYNFYDECGEVKAEYDDVETEDEKEITEVNNCMNCKHDPFSEKHSLCCNDCYGFNHWEPKEKPCVKVECQKCFYFELEDAPCHNCYDCDKWKPKKEYLEKEKTCYLCVHKDTEEQDAPCNSCVGHSAWVLNKNA